MKTLPGLFKNAFKKHKMKFGGWYMFGLNEDLTFFLPVYETSYSSFHKVVL